MFRHRHDKERGEVMAKKWVKHLYKEGARYHVLSYDSNGVHCSEENCEINKATPTLPQGTCHCKWEPGTAVPVKNIKRPVCPKCGLPFPQGGITKIEPLKEIRGRYETQSNATLYDFVVENRDKINKIINRLNKEEGGSK